MRCQDWLETARCRRHEAITQAGVSSRTVAFATKSIDPVMLRNGYTRSSSAGSRPRPGCRRRIQRPCCSGRCLLPARSTCARSMVGKVWPQSPSISQLTSQLDPIPSVTRKLRHAKFEPHHGRPCYARRLRVEVTICARRPPSEARRPDLERRHRVRQRHVMLPR